MSKNNSKSLRINILVFLTSLAILIIAAELLLRVFGLADPVLYRQNPIYGYEPKPKQSSVRLGVPIFINDVGLRDDEDYDSMKSNKKILLIGDSVTYGGSRTNQEDLFTEVLERKLRTQEPGIKVLNAGVNGYSISQMFHRAEQLMQDIEPDFLIIYAVRRDFFRPPVTFISEGNIIYPTKKPRFALIEFLLLSINHLNKRYRFLDVFPAKLTQWLKPPVNFTPNYDKLRIIELHFEVIKNFIENTWESSGRSRSKILVFLAPERKDVVENLTNQNKDLIALFDSLNLPAYDLQKDFYSAILSKDQKISDYYWDDVHYVEKGHSLAAEILYQYIIRNEEFLQIEAIEDAVSDKVLLD
jgi:lysophospholipase L1-like esterase